MKWSYSAAILQDKAWWLCSGGQSVTMMLNPVSKDTYSELRAKFISSDQSCRRKMIYLQRRCLHLDCLWRCMSVEVKHKHKFMRQNWQNLHINSEMVQWEPGGLMRTSNNQTPIMHRCEATAGAPGGLRASVFPVLPLELWFVITNVVSKWDDRTAVCVKVSKKTQLRWVGKICWNYYKMIVWGLFEAT